MPEKSKHDAYGKVARQVDEDDRCRASGFRQQIDGHPERNRSQQHGDADLDVGNPAPQLLELVLSQRFQGEGREEPPDGPFTEYIDGYSRQVLTY